MTRADDVRECIDAAREVFERAAENDGALGPDDVRTLRVAFDSLVAELDAAHNLFAAFGKDEGDGAHVVPQRSAAWELGFVLAMQRALGELGPSLAKGLLSVPEARASLRDACAEAGELAETMVLEHALSLAKKGT